jgi:hypothetical protein
VHRRTQHLERLAFPVPLAQRIFDAGKVSRRVSMDEMARHRHDRLDGLF